MLLFIVMVYWFVCLFGGGMSGILPVLEALRDKCPLSLPKRYKK
uniref:Uncharacterized protein n=1 Tax=Anguilla anguilla TaxID=7936 RepID=A0A0E9WWY7_ANGAN